MAKRKVEAENPEHALASSASDSSEDTSSVETSSSSDGSDSEEESPSSSPGSEDLVNVDFEFFDPKPTDFHGVKALLKVYLEDARWDISGFVDLILAQTTVGTVVKTSSEDSPIGIISALNLARYKDCPCMQEVHHYMTKKINGKPEAVRFEEMWNKHSKVVGLLVSERLVNIPMELVPPLYQGLFDEIMWGTEDEPTQELRDSFKFKQYLLLTTVFEELPKKVKGSDVQKSGKKQRVNAKDREDLIFIKPEDEIFLQLSSWSFTFPVNAEAQAAHETRSVKQLRLVMAVDGSQIPAFTSGLKALID